MRAGPLSDRILVQRQTEEGPDTYGNMRTAWTTYGSYWADVRPVPGRERVAAGAMEATAMATVRLRSTATTRAIEAADRIVMRGAIWNIRTLPVPAGPRAEWVELTCEAGVAT